jgi:DNA-directed RNA polymerase specialized sigma24 family protein
LVLILRYVDDLAVAAVAKEIGKSVRATEPMLARARAALSAAYDEVPDV